MVPVFFLIANLGEYFGHRGPMHHRRARPRDHLRAPHAAAPPLLSPRRDGRRVAARFQMVLFPPVMLLFFLGGLATPIGLLLSV